MIPEKCAVGSMMKRRSRMKRTRHHSRPGMRSSTCGEGRGRELGHSWTLWLDGAPWRDEQSFWGVQSSRSE